MAIDVEATFEKYDDANEYLEFKRIPEERRLHARPDLCAFLLLDKLCPGDRDMVSAGEHDVIFPDVDVEELAKVATEEDILTLIRCGVHYSSEYDCLALFV